MRIDLNADLGESWERWHSGEDVELLGVVTSANVCCGAYAGDAELMRVTCEAAVERGVAIGAQIGYPDREGFGRKRVDVPAAELTAELLDQVRQLDEIARAAGGRVAYVKPHGALYNTIVHDEAHARAVVDTMRQLASPIPLLGLPGAVSLSLAQADGLPVVHEGFADRAYTPEGRLVARTEVGAVLDDPRAVAAQAVRLLGDVASICVHSDSPGAVRLARAVRSALEDAGAQLASAP
ncbi:LamB/YcsF family protein [Aeromicrobium chenweiae]|uniref:LamB/YcsF family protein n=1 Tax=Aeromicrobium chenweiae TaxID=2079793 RepID=A0A2S0WPU3_9ACTN|nr:5-oxoprolinase subunit PxpA [Aeromicrobium chenweiae]AWB93336.1 LamB/YcsF family protein [Aeromicrobium chenweiae]TGN34326.1 LamB/YcsF family protein [Aeromicrobium chenweiae]